MNDSATQLKSMTGYGTASEVIEGILINVEIKTINSRFFDLQLKNPPVYNSMGAPIRAAIVQQIQRGRVEVMNKRTNQHGDDGKVVTLNQELFDHYIALYRRAAQQLGIALNTQSEHLLGQLLRHEGVLELSEGMVDVSTEYEGLLRVVQQAVNQLEIVRMAEGSHLQHDITERLAKIEQLHQQVRAHIVNYPQAIREKLQRRLAELSIETTIDPARIAAEIVLYVDRADVTEELVRLESHIHQFLKALPLACSGKKLEFFLQEIGREWNTITSKVQDAQVQTLVVEAKTELEKIREQVQNVE